MHDGFRNCVTLKGPITDHMCTKFGVDSSSSFSFRVLTHTHTVTDITDHSIHTDLVLIWVIEKLASAGFERGQFTTDSGTENDAQCCRSLFITNFLRSIKPITLHSRRNMAKKQKQWLSSDTGPRFRGCMLLLEILEFH